MTVEEDKHPGRCAFVPGAGRCYYPVAGEGRRFCKNHAKREQRELVTPIAPQTELHTPSGAPSWVQINKTFSRFCASCRSVQTMRTEAVELDEKLRAFTERHTCTACEKSQNWIRYVGRPNGPRVLRWAVRAAPSLRARVTLPGPSLRARVTLRPVA